jgi:hypothetical protein
MKRFFENSKSFWVRYNDYVIREDGNGVKYLQAGDGAVPEPYDPTDILENLVVDALNVGWTCMDSDLAEEEKEDAVCGFVLKYGMLGFMTALPTTPRFLSYENVYFDKNHFIKKESMTVEDYLAIFFPFEKLKLRKKNEEYTLEIEGDKHLVALATMTDGRPLEVHMSFQREYTERMDWLKQQFKDWAFSMMTIFFYYEDLDHVAEDAKEYYRQSMAAFDGITPTYHIELQDEGPMLVWNLNSLLQGIQLMICSMLTDKSNPVKMCRNCGKAFIAKKYRDKFCRRECSEEYKQSE